MDHLVLTVFAPDKAGQVEQIALCIAEHGGNWLESRMSGLAGQFVGIVRVEAPAETHDALIKALQALASQGIQIQVIPGTGEAPGRWKPIAMELVGNDRPGIVRDITRLLTEQGINLEQLVTDVSPAPMSGDPLFHAEAILAVPFDLPLDALQAGLETLADELMVELMLRSEDE
ncbi:glycine cleavage system protein R [Pseudomonas gingeri]|uniref:glycine cleavage system protein R n=1 Tax=Pseudomonas gingeri TaxID=117681 RepID=UPI0015A36D2A|nr:glycine cleavage system protein R [Pseudomonas gingeri]NWD70130.1 glycine cleavage system protein R [Pseudomonas gingeri]NWD78460.1 glycine cleavage system protein R [Pseudomonas gingeri]